MAVRVRCGSGSHLDLDMMVSLHNDKWSLGFLEMVVPRWLTYIAFVLNMGVSGLVFCASHLPFKLYRIVDVYGKLVKPCAVPGGVLRGEVSGRGNVGRGRGEDPLEVGLRHCSCGARSKDTQKYR